MNRWALLIEKNIKQGVNTIAVNFSAYAYQFDIEQDEGTIYFVELTNLGTRRGEKMSKYYLASRLAKLIVIVGRQIKWSDPNLAFAEKQSEVNLQQILNSEYSNSELFNLLDYLLTTLDDLPES